MSTKLYPTPPPTAARIRTPLARVRGLGSAKDGTEHFWRQRLTGACNAVLVTSLIVVLLRLVGADYATVKGTLANPIVSLLFLGFILSGTYHMRLGMQVIIEDYAHGGAKMVLLFVNTFFTVAVALASALAVLKLSFGA